MAVSGWRSRQELVQTNLIYKGYLKYKSDDVLLLLMVEK